MKPILFIVTLFFSSLVMAQQDKPIDVPQIAVKIPLAEVIKLDGIEITFLKVLEDSRCPRNVECIRAGEAKVLVSIKSEEGEAVEKTLAIKNGLAAIAGLFMDKELQFLQLTPYPDANISVADRAPYVLLMRAVKK